MTVRVMHNRRNLSATLHFTGSNTVVIAGNSSVSAIALPGEELTGGQITQVWFGSPSGEVSYWTVKRGANTVAVLDSTGFVDYAGCGCSLTLDQEQSLVVELTGTTGYLIVEVQKVGSAFDNEYFQS